MFFSSHHFYFYLTLAALTLVSLCRGDCAEPLPLREQFAVSENVVLLRAVAKVQEESCFYEVYTDDYVLTNQLNLYKVVQVFKGTAANVGAEIPVLFSTDTGYWLDIPFSDQDDILAFLYTVDGCFPNNSNNNSDASYVSPYPQELEPAPFEMNECNWNPQWSTVSEEDKAFLRGQQGCGGCSDELSGMWARIICRSLCWLWTFLASL